MPRNHAASAVLNAFPNASAAERDVSCHSEDHNEEDIVGMAPSAIPPASETDLTKAAITPARATAALVADKAKKAAKLRKLLVPLCASVVAANSTFRSIPLLASAANAGDDATSDAMDQSLLGSLGWHRWCLRMDVTKTKN
ncbi:uncharacterized protein LY79DRAFT_673860 [Colletotrichum navitas]|uniref:Uncharacterized protein n=1 Tax=Colletotrichum navitas TaxID=681940 RepID=A0AAD8PMV1_9PEZI|nr:uncharacterized protein LY79DRAFT_673860 [Colletotrichum navitas]KAK1573077.1 hypothetical protein LY79DRAFT_673860 [Colletotrichum navitas]